MKTGRLSKYLVDEFEQLGTHGYQIVENAVPNFEALRNKILDDMSILKKEHNVQNGHLLQQYGCGQWESLWECRISTLKTWSRLYKTNSLLSSWDALSIIEPYEHSMLAKQLNEHGEPEWMHRDQKCSNRNLADTIQGFLSLGDVGEDGYSTVFFVPKAGTAQELLIEFHNTFHTRYTKSGRIAATTYDEEEADYYQYTQKELEFLRERCNFIKPRLKGGDLLLWCSTTPHAAGSSILCNATTPMRIGTYVSMLPSHFANPCILSDRRKLASYGLTSSHNVLNTRLFPFDLKLQKNTTKRKIVYTEEIAKTRSLLIG